MNFLKLIVLGIVFSSFFIILKSASAEHINTNQRKAGVPLPPKLTRIKAQKLKKNTTIGKWVQSIKPAAGTPAINKDQKPPYWLQRTNRSRRVSTSHQSTNE